MTFYYDNLKIISLKLLKYIESLNIKDRQIFCNLSTSILNNKCAKPYWIAGAICKHYIIDKNEKIYIVYPTVEDMDIKRIKPKHISQINYFSEYKLLGRLIRKILLLVEKYSKTKIL